MTCSQRSLEDRVSRRERREQVLDDNEYLRRTIAQREEVLLQYEEEFDRVKHITHRTVQALTETVQV